MRAFDGVLFDFGHTLFDTVPADVCTAEFGTASGTDVDPGALAATWDEIRERSRQPEALAKGRDLSAEAHRRCWLELLTPLDDLASGLAEFVYGLECSSRGWRPYPDAAGVLAELRRRGIPVGVVSDCGWDIRAVFAVHQLSGCVDAFVLSYERGACKPDPRLFEAACSELRVETGRALMVGDHPRNDGGAAALGITTLILPARDRTAFPALAPVLDLTR
jgi:HAD superfamily hydrolase (TIGR01509 family)